jgi:hypothetical protein
MYLTTYPFSKAQTEVDHVLVTYYFNHGSLHNETEDTLTEVTGD